MSVKIKKIGNDATNKIMVRLNTDKLEMIEKELGKSFVAQIGVLGVKASREVKISGESEDQYRNRVKKIQKNKEESSGASDLSNADIGLIHEKGSPPRGIPRRSFLEMPLTTKMPGMMQKVGAYILKGLEASNITMAYKNLGAVGESIVLQAFNTRGFGSWKPNAPSTIQRKGSDIPLIDSAQLRASITNRVVTK